MSNEKATHYRVLAHCTEEQLAELAAFVLAQYPQAQVTLLTPPRQGLVMLRMHETVADGQFNAGEVLVTEVRLELDGQFGYGMVIGDNERRAMAIAMTDAAIRKGGPVAAQLNWQIAALADSIAQRRKREAQAVAGSKVSFETF